MSEVLLISDCAKQVDVESHVLRYWEEELGLPIHRNELGHRIYTREDVEVFQRIKELKEKGLQLKAVKYLLQNDCLDSDESLELLEDAPMGESEGMQIEILECRDAADDGSGLKCDLGRQRTKHERKNTKEHRGISEERMEQVMRLEKLIGRLIQESVREAIYESRREICREILSDLEEDGWKSFRDKSSPEAQRVVHTTPTSPAQKICPASPISPTQTIGPNKTAPESTEPKENDPLPAEPEENDPLFTEPGISDPGETEPERCKIAQEVSSGRGEEYYRRVDQMIRFGAGNRRGEGKTGEPPEAKTMMVKASGAKVSGTKASATKDSAAKTPAAKVPGVKLHAKGNRTFLWIHRS